MLAEDYIQSTRYQKLPDDLKVQRIANHLKNKGHKPIDFEMKEV